MRNCILSISLPRVCPLVWQSCSLSHCHQGSSRQREEEGEEVEGEEEEEEKEEEEEEEEEGGRCMELKWILMLGRPMLKRVIKGAI